MAAQLINVGNDQFVLLPLSEYEGLAKAARIVADSFLDPIPSIGPAPVPKDGESRLRAWRKYRGLTLEELGAAVGKPKSFLSQIETGRSLGKPQLWVKLAEVLRADIDAILPDKGR